MISAVQLFRCSISRWLDTLNRIRAWHFTITVLRTHRWKQTAMFWHQPSIKCASRGLRDNFDILQNNFIMLGNSGWYQIPRTVNCLAEARNKSTVPFNVAQLHWNTDSHYYCSNHWPSGFLFFCPISCHVGSCIKLMQHKTISDLFHS